MNNEDKKVYGLINQYYYDIESSKIYFGTFRIWKLRRKRLWIFLALIICFFLAIFSVFVILLNAMNLIKVNSIIHNVASSYIIWIVYILSLILYVGCFMHIEDRKFDILKIRYNKENIVDIQHAWIKENLPSTVNKKILINKIVEWEDTNIALNFYSNEFRMTGKIFQSSHFNVVFKAILSVFPIIISVNLLNGISIEEFSAENPISYLLIMIYIVIFIVILGVTYGSMRPLFERLLCHIDGHKSKGTYRFNIFKKMLSNHVTLKELNES